MPDVVILMTKNNNLTDKQIYFVTIFVIVLLPILIIKNIYTGGTHNIIFSYIQTCLFGMFIMLHIVVVKIIKKKKGLNNNG